MACCSDVVILHESARFGIPEPKVGFIPSQIIPFVVRRMGEGAVRDLAVTGRVIDAAEARRLGVGGISAPAADIEPDAARRLLDDILKMEPRRWRRSSGWCCPAPRRMIAPCSTMRRQSLVGLLRQPEAAEGIRHFMAKTTPSWAKR